MFRRLFPRKPAPLAGAPAIRRIKNYTAQSGYVYQYFFEGHRPHSPSAVEFLFRLSGDRKTWFPLAVVLPDESLHSWERAHGRELSSTERYAIAKMALFQAFDERPSPAHFREPVHIRPADVEGFIAALGL